MKKIITIVLLCLCFRLCAQTISRVEYFIDSDPGLGIATPVSFTPGSNITTSFNVDLSSTSTGLHNLVVRAKDTNGYWSLSNVVLFYKSGSALATIAEIEYFIDADPGFGAATDVSFTPSSNVTTALNINVSTVSTGLHSFNVRAKDAHGVWSATTSMPLYITSGQTSNIVRIEYFIDSDPGFGSATLLPFTPSSDVVAITNIDMSSVSPGLHTLNVRSEDQFGTWSHTNSLPLYVISGDLTDIRGMEYFIDTDPGFGSGISVPVTPSSNINQNFLVNTSGLLPGLHTLHVRVQDESGLWSLVNSSAFAITGDGAANIVGFEYAIDTDPGYGAGTFIAPSAPSSSIDEIINLDVGTLSVGTHKLFIRPRDANGTWGMTEVLSFEFCNLNAPVANAAMDVGTKSFGASWSAVSGATSYKLDVSSDDFASFVPGYNNKDVSATSQLVTSLASKTGYKFRVRTFGVCTSESSNVVPVTTYEATQAADSLALVELYNAADGPAWFNKTNWLTAPVVTWDGIGITSERVTLVDLASNNLKGSVPPQMTNLTALTSLDLSDNSLSAFPDISGLSSLSSLKLQDNNFTFEDLEPNASVGGIVYSPQNRFGTGDTLVITVDDPFDFTFSVGGSANTYQWLHNGAPVGGENSNNISRLTTLSDDGVWNLRATNSILPSLTLTSNDVRVIIQLPGILTDSLSLVALYNATNGPGWITHTNWLTGQVKNWSGVGVTNNKVVSLNLSSNNLTGEIPSDITQMLNVTAINLSSNHLTTLPDMSVMPSLSTLNVSQNFLQFASLEPNVTIDNFSYGNQAAIGTPQYSEVYALESFNLEAIVSGANNVYAWKLNDSPIPDATDPEISIGEITRESEGTYVCDVTNSVVPGLTIKTATHELLPVADLSGMVLINDDELVTAGAVTLMEIQAENGYDTIAVVEVNSSGEYFFEKVKLRDYAIVGFPDTVSYPGALPTYYQNTLFWEEADEIAVNATLADLDIDVQSKPEDVPVGEGVIRGVLWEDDGTGRNKTPKRVGGAGVTARRVEGSGRGKETLELVDYQFTNEDGEFEIRGLTQDEFRLNILYPGYPMDLTSDVIITIGDNYKAEKEVEATVEDGKIVVREILITSTENDAVVKVYPNPASAELTLQFPNYKSNREIIVYHLTGQKVMTRSILSAGEQLDLRGLAKGVYQIRVTEAGKLVHKSKLVVK